MAIEIVDFPINSMVDLSSSLCNKLPEGNMYENHPILGVSNFDPYARNGNTILSA